MAKRPTFECSTRFELHLKWWRRPSKGTAVFKVDFFLGACLSFSVMRHSLKAFQFFSFRLRARLRVLQPYRCYKVVGFLHTRWLALLAFLILKLLLERFF